MLIKYLCALTLTFDDKGYHLFKKACQILINICLIILQFLHKIMDKQCNDLYTENNW